MSIPLVILLCLASLLSGMAVVLFWTVPKMESHFVFRPTREISRTPADFGIPYEQHILTAPDQARLCVWHLYPKKPRASVLYFHGNSGNLGLYSEIFRLLFEHHIQVIAVDYRGYGLSSGNPSEKGIYKDGLAMIDFFGQNLRQSDLPVIYWGRSLGGCVAAFAAARQPPDGLILETTFPSKKSLLEHFPEFKAFRFFSRYRFNTIRHLKGHRFPVLVIHGTADRTVPFKQGQILYRLLDGPKEFFEIEGADHVTTHRLNLESYMSRILSFLSRAHAFSAGVSFTGASDNIVNDRPEVRD